MGDFIETIDSGLCIGCGYCASLFDWQMKFNEDGFLTPVIGEQNDLNHHKSDLINRSCPGINASDVTVADPLYEGSAQQDYMWGQFLEVSTAYSTDPVVRHAGSSGGVLTGLARWLVETGRVDEVLVTTYALDEPIQTQSVVSSSADVLLQGAGSKYCPGSPLSILNEIREKPGKYAVIAKPCDIATLRRAISNGDVVGNSIVLLISFFCAGTPSDRGNRELLTKLGVQSLEDVATFRHRGQGWPGFTTATLKNGEEKSCSYNDAWGGILRRHLHKLCRICADGIGEQADIVAADAWYGDDGGYPQFVEADGRSLLLARTEVGKRYLDEMTEAGALVTECLDIREVDKMQPGQINRRRQLRMRVLGFKLVGLRVPFYNNRALKNYESGMSLRSKFRSLAATMKRTIKWRFQGGIRK